MFGYSSLDSPLHELSKDQTWACAPNKNLLTFASVCFCEFIYLLVQLEGVVLVANRLLQLKQTSTSDAGLFGICKQMMSLHDFGHSHSDLIVPHLSFREVIFFIFFGIFCNSMQSPLLLVDCCHFGRSPYTRQVPKCH